MDSKPVAHHPVFHARSAEELASFVVERAPFTLLVDGPSGAGKTSFATRLATQQGWDIVHLDDFYPGWHGLAAGAEMVARDVLHPQRPGFRRWDWDRDCPGEWVGISSGPRTRPLIVEGVGALTDASLAAARRLGPVCAVLIDGPRDVRRARALRRDPGYAPWFDVWAQQERTHFAALPQPDAAWRWR